MIAFAAAIAALLPRKGGILHRQAGKAFVISMLLMAGSGALIALSMQVTLSVIGGVVTLYLVLSGWLTVTRAGKPPGIVEGAGLLLMLFMGGLAVFSGLEAANSESGLKNGFHPGQYYMFAILALLAAAGDIRLILVGGLTGTQRIARHLWRMCMALTIAAAAFFLGQAGLFPDAIRDSHVLAVPVLASLLVMIYWLTRVALTRAYGAQRAGTAGRCSAAAGSNPS
jgi:hypothetical protein